MPNRLVDEPSPYLQQHAHNPVDWYPWGEEAFEAARDRDKPLFVSIGYATCHWCHVMERESFENEAIARLMNDAFVNVKVDREERPDVDGIYMTVCQMLTGHGGWPLNVVLTPDRKPIFAGTYIPPSSMQGRIGMLELVPRLKQVWDQERHRMETSAAEITELLQKEASGDLRSDVPGRASVNEAAQLLERDYDSTHAGFGQAPKFPMPHYIRLLLRHAAESDTEKGLEMAAATLRAMARGGIYDQIGFGFHRYSTDRQWLVPHFEKMLYDQATLLEAYVEGFLATGEAEFAVIASEVARYVRRDLTAPEGGFYSAEDADSEGEEGKFYVWTTEELLDVLGEEDGRTAVSRFNVTPEGNYLDESTRRKTGSNILHLNATASLSRDEKAESIRERLLERRSGRIRPQLDDKILTDWNGLMIASLAKAGIALSDDGLVEVAQSAARFILERLVDDDALLHRFRDGTAGIDGHLDDYAFFAQGCYELFNATFDASWLERSLQLTESMLENFWDDEHDGFFFAAAGSDDLVVRRKEIQDGAIPSGLSSAVLNLARLGRLVRREDLAEKASAAAASVARSVARYPTAHTALLSVVGHLQGDGGEVVIAGPRDNERTQAMLAAAREGFHPSRLIVALNPENETDPLFDIAPHFKDYLMQGGQPTAYVCEDFVCQAPTTDVEELKRQLS